MINFKCGRFIPVVCALFSPLLITVSNATEIIIDNKASEGVTITGDWITSMSRSGYYADDYIHDNYTSDGHKSVAFSPTLQSSGTYEVYLWWSGNGNRATQVPVTISHATGNTTVNINQKLESDEWVSVGDYDFNVGDAGTVTISNEGSNGYVIADAVRFVKKAKAATDTPLPSIEGDSWVLTFEDNFEGTVLDGDKWRLGSHHSAMGGVGVIDPKVINVADGYLNLSAKINSEKISSSGVDSYYSSAQISTYANFNQRYGYFEARLKSPAVTGLWPSFWMMPEREIYGDVNGYYRAYIKFNLTDAGLTASDIVSASLKLYPAEVEAYSDTSPNNVIFQKLHDDAWSESSITWNNKPTPNPAWIAQKWNTLSVAEAINVDVLDYVIEEVSGDKVISFVLADTFMRTKTVAFHSNDAAAGLRPKLVINGVSYDVSEDAQVFRGDKDSSDDTAQGDDNYASSTVLTVSESYGNGSYTEIDPNTDTDQGMEFDIMESLGVWGENISQHVVHWGGYSMFQQTQPWEGITYPASEDDFHTYGVYWQDDILEFYIDGKKTAESKDNTVGDVASYLLLSLQLGGWDDNTVTDLVNGEVMQVDWVRVWTGTRTEVSSDEVIVDNADVATDSDTVLDTDSVEVLTLATDNWAESTNTTGYYGSNYLHDGDKGGETYTFYVDIESAGTYWIYGRWSSNYNRATDVPVLVDGAPIIPIINQTEKGGAWVYFSEKIISEADISADGKVRVTVKIGDVDSPANVGYMVADAVRAFRVAN